MKVEAASYVAEQHARFLSESDVVSLFGKIQSVLGSRKDAAQECGLTRKSIYNWNSLKQEIKLSTKAKILDKALEYFPIDTMDYLTRQTVDSSSELLMSYLLTLYENALQTTDPKEFVKLADKFEQAKREYSGLIYKRHERELDELSAKLETYGKSIGSNWKFTTNHYLYDTRSLKTIVQEIVKFLTIESAETPEELAIRLGVPLQVIDEARKVLVRDQERYAFAIEPAYAGVEGSWGIGGTINIFGPIDVASVPLQASIGESVALGPVNISIDMRETQKVRMVWNQNFVNQHVLQHAIQTSDQYSIQRNTASEDYNKKLLTAATVQGVAHHGK